MKKYILLFSILMIYASMAFGQGASVSLPSINASSVGQTVTVPINVNNFTNIGSVTFNIQYNSAVLTYVDVANKPTSGTFWADTSNGKLSILWYSTSGANFTNKFADIQFVYKGGSSDLKFVPTFEVTDPNGVAISATSTDGGVYGNLPVITIGTKSATAGSSVTVPVTAEKLSNVGAISLKIQYDTNVLTYTGSENILAGSDITVEHVNGIITINKYSGNAITSASAKLVDLKFNYISGTSNLAFVDADCELADGSGNPIGVNLVDGSVAGDLTTITIGNASGTPGSAVTVPVNATKLTNVGAISLKIQYDTNVLTYTGTENILAGSDITVEHVNGVITINKYSGNAITSASAKLVDLKFNYISGTSNLAFVDADCELADGSGNPIAISLNDGRVSGEQATVAIGTVNGTAGSAVTVPVNATKLTNVGAISLKIQYNASNLTYVGTANILTGSDITVENVNGVITINKYSGNAITTASAKLVDLKFTYVNGDGSLAFVDADCELADGDGNPIAVTLTDGGVSTANQAEVKIASKQATSGAQVIIPVTATNLSGVAAVSLKLQYNTGVLTYVGTENILAGSDITVENVNGVITINKYTGSAITTASAKLVDLKFNYISGTSNLAFVDADCELADANGNPISVKLTDGRVSPASSTKLLLQDTYVKASVINTDVTVPVKVDKFSNIGSISLKIEYDPTILTFKSADNKANAAIDVTDAAGVLSIGWYGTTPLTIADNGKLLDLKFTFKKAQTAQMTFDQVLSEITDGEGTVLYVAYTNGKVAPNQLPVFNSRPSDKTVKATKQLYYAYNVTDPDGSTLSYRLESAPAGAAISSTGRVTWTPTESQVRSTAYKLIAVVSDSYDEVKDTVLVQVEPISGIIEQTIPTEFSLYQNNPNPFNPTTSIKYALPKESKVVLKVYNLLGQEVATLVNEFQNVGTHTVRFNAADLPTGLYLYRIDADNFTAIKKMMLVK